MSRPVSSHIGIAPPKTPANESETRLYGWRLATARGVTFTAIGLALGLYLLALPGLFPRMSIPCADAMLRCLIFPEQVAPLAGLGITPSSLAVMVIMVSCASILLVVSVSAMLIWRRSDDWMALFLALTLIVMPANFTPVLHGLPDALYGASQVFSAASFIMLYLLLGIFPSGRFVPRWLWLPIAGLGIQATIPLPPLNAVAETIVEMVSLIFQVCLIGSQLYRYRRIALPVQRQQIKWGVYGLVLTIIVNQVFWQPVIWLPALQRPDSLYLLLAGPDSFLMIGILAVSFGIAILRYRLYDIDVLIRRTLVYGTLTAILAGVYLALVLGAQAASHAITGKRGEEPIVIVASTLLIAALFQPLRSRIQRVIDRRFYRAKYDATRTVERFAASLQQQVELDQLSAHLVEVVEETVQPEHVSLWLSSSPGRREQPAWPNSFAMPGGETP